MNTKEFKQQTQSWYTCTNHDDMCFTNTGELLVATSSLTNRYWKGMISLYENMSDNSEKHGREMKKLIEPPKCNAYSENTITNIKYLSASNRAVTTHDSGELVIWQISQDDTEMIEMFCEVGHDDAVLSLGVNADQSRLATTSSDCQLNIWSTDECATLAAYTGHSETVSGVSFHPSSNHLLSTCSYDQSLLFWDLRKLKPVTQSYEFSDIIPSTLTYINTDCNLVMIGSESGQIIIMDTRNLTSAVSKVDLHKRNINRMLFSPKNSSLLATCSDDLSIIVSKLHKDSSLQTLHKDSSHSDFVRGLAWSPTKPTELASCSWDGNVYFHNIPTPVEASKIGAGDV